MFLIQKNKDTNNICKQIKQYKQLMKNMAIEITSSN